MRSFKALILAGTMLAMLTTQAFAEERSYMGAIVGSVVGGVLGNQVGKGNGRTAATVAGAVAGGFIGDRIDNHQPQNPIPLSAAPAAVQAERPGVFLAGDPSTDVYRCTTGGLCWLVRNGVPDDRSEYRPDYERNKGYLCNPDGRCYRVLQ